MAKFKDQVLRAWDEWETQTAVSANNPDDFVEWALAKSKLAPQPRDIRRLLRSQVMDALRQAVRTDEEGITYRAKQCVRISEEGVQMTLVFDSDKATYNLQSKASAQQRKAIVNDIYRAKSNADHFNNTHPEEKQIKFVLDFTDDVAELDTEEKGRKPNGGGKKAA